MKTMRAKWSFSASLFCLAASHNRLFRFSTAAADASLSTLAFGIVPSVPPGDSTSSSSSRRPSNEHDDDALVRRLRANTAGIWSLRIRSGSTAQIPLGMPPNLLGAAPRAETEDPWSPCVLQPSKEMTEGRRRGETTAAATTTTRSDKATVLLHLRQDGSFRQCNEGYVEGRWMVGRWSILAKYVEAATQQDAINDSSKSLEEYSWLPRLYLALDRQYYGPPVDTLFDGSFPPPEVKEGTTNHSPTPMQVTGRIRTGKFALSKTDPAFFERAWEGTLLIERGASEAESSENDQNATFVLTQLVSSRSLAENHPPETASPTAWVTDDGNTFQFRAMPQTGLHCNPRYAT